MELDNVVAFLAGKAAGGGGGGGGDITVEALSATENGTYTAPAGKAYSPVTVNVPNSYAAADEGKVVSNGALVAQTAHAEVTSNGTIDTTLYNSVPVNVPSPIVKHIGSITVATNTKSLIVTGLGAPAVLVRLTIDDYDNKALDGVAKIIGGCYADGARQVWRTNSAGTSVQIGDNGSYADLAAGRTVQPDNTIVANRFVSTTTGWTFNQNHDMYNFKAGYTYNYVCYTYPES